MYDMKFGGAGSPPHPGHRIEVVCPTDRAHYVKKNTYKWFRKYVCKHCKSKFLVFRYNFFRWVV